MSKPAPKEDPYFSAVIRRLVEGTDADEFSWNRVEDVSNYTLAITVGENEFSVRYHSQELGIDGGVVGESKELMGSIKASLERRREADRQGRLAAACTTLGIEVPVQGEDRR